MEIKYEHTMTGQYNETIAIIDDGRRISVDTQYGMCAPLGKHADGCSQVTKMGGRCDCGMLDGIDCDALIADAKINGKFGAAPQPAPINTDVHINEWRSPRGLTLTEEMDRDDTIY